MRAVPVRRGVAVLAALLAFPLVVIVLVLGSTGDPQVAPAAGTAPVTAGLAAGDGAAAGGSAWARSLLAAGGWPVTSCNVGAIVAWERAEGSTPAWRNLLDTTLREPGSHPVNSVGVQAYPSVREGLAATVATLHGGAYGPILTALANSDDAQAVADAVAASPWGTEPFTATCAG